MFTESLFYAYVPWNECALVPHADNIIPNYRMKYIYVHYLYVYIFRTHVYNAKGKILLFSRNCRKKHEMSRV